MDSGLSPQEAHQRRAAEDVEVDGDLVQKENAEFLEETDANLHAPALPVRHPVHSPLRVDAHDLRANRRISSRTFFVFV